MKMRNGLFSISSASLKYKLKIAFYLMSVLPLLVCIYLVASYVLPRTGFRMDILFAVGISIVIAAGGFWVIKEVFDRVVFVSSEAKRVVSGDMTVSLRHGGRDELDDLSHALNQLTLNIRNNISELKSYGERTAEANLEIQRCVIVLSNLLHINSLISHGAKLEDILELIVEKARQLADSDIAFLLYREEGRKTFYMKSADGGGKEYLSRLTLEPKEELFAGVFNVNKPLVVDNKVNTPGALKEALRERFKLKNAAGLPIYLHGRVAAFLGIGNSRDLFAYRKEDLDMLGVFAKQTAVAVENDILNARVARMDIKDPLTGLLSEAHTRVRLEEEIAHVSSYHSMCSLVLFDVDNFKEYHARNGLLKTEVGLKRVALVIRDAVSEIGSSGRIGDDEFVVLLPEKNKRQAHEIGETIRRKITAAFGAGSGEAGEALTVSAGVSENPLDGTTAEQLIAAAREMVVLAKQQGRNRIVSYREPPVCR